MTKIHIQGALKACAAIAVVSGLLFLIQGNSVHLSGSLTGQGATTVPPSIASIHAAAAMQEYNQAYAGIAIIVGMLLILIGLMLHALLLVYLSHDRPVPVHGPTRNHKTLKRDARRQRAIEVFWIEEHIRV